MNTNIEKEFDELTGKLPIGIREIMRDTPECRRITLSIFCAGVNYGLNNFMRHPEVMLELKLLAMKILSEVRIANEGKAKTSG